MNKILIVDDDAQNREILKLRLEQAGFDVQEAVNGEDGVMMAQEHSPDAILLDVMMPKMDGWQVCRRLKSNPKTKRIPVIMLTARNQQVEELKGWESGADEYLTKPCDHADLLKALETILDARKENKP